MPQQTSVRERLKNAEEPGRPEREQQAVDGESHVLHREMFEDLALARGRRRSRQHEHELTYLEPTFPDEAERSDQQTEFDESHAKSVTVVQGALLPFTPELAN